MGSEIEKTNRPAGPAIYTAEVRRAIDTRTELTLVPEVMQALTSAEKRMIIASTKPPISEISDNELLPKLATIVKYVARDAGIKTVDEYDTARFMNVIKLYYSSLSLQEIRIAFELSMIGELDGYLPKDKDGKPDKNHYQAFNLDYITKILNAYKKRKNEADYKAYSVMPKREKETSQEKKKYYDGELKKTVIISFLEYKYRGKLSISANYYRIYEEIQKVGLAEPIKITESDKKEAVGRLLRKAENGVIGQFIAECIRRQQTKHSYVDAESKFIALQKAVINSFDILTKEEIQITDYITQN